jgi:SAM-dependent methyltransferase
VLDVGAGDGALLAALRSRGREAVGLERDAAEEGERREIFDTPDGDWAAIVFWHSLEHLREPGRAIERAAQLLRSGGVLFVAVPNSASLQAKLFGDRWFALDIPRHLVHLTAPALLHKLEASGLQIERVSYARGGQVVFGWVHGLVALLPGRRNLYDAIRRPAARSRPMSLGECLVTLTLGALALPIAWFAAVAEVLLRRGGTVYVEARRA